MADQAPRRDGPYEAPIERLAGGRGQRGRAIAALLAIAVVLGGAIGLARLSDDAAARADAARVARTGQASAGPPTSVGPPSPDASALSPGASTTAGRSIGPRVERLVDAPGVALAGAPSVLLVERDGLDIRIERWSTGAAPAPDRTFHAALQSEATDPLTVLAPTDDRLLVLDPDVLGSPAGDRGRLVDPTGRVLWSADHLSAPSGAAWSSDGRLVVVAGTDRRWHLVRIAADGTATDRPVALPFRVFLPTPLPKSDLSVPRVDPRTLPLGFSADGRWAYGGIPSTQLGIMVAMFRVAVDGSTVEPVADLGVGRPDGLAPDPGSLGGRLVDPVTGRIATLRANADASSGPPAIEVRNPDAGFVFAIEDGTPLGYGWAADGGLYVLSADAPLFANRIRLERYFADGGAGPPLLETGPLTGANLLGIRDGFAVVALAATRPDRAIQLVAIDLGDPARISAVPLPDTAGQAIIGVDLRG